MFDQRRKKVRHYRHDGDPVVVDLFVRLEGELAGRRLHAAEVRELPRGWLLPYRSRFRQIIAAGRAGTLKRVMATVEVDLQPVAIWLISRCANPCQLCGLDHLIDSPSPAVRIHLARALRRLEAWSCLRRMVAAHPGDARLNYFATAPPPAARREFRDRMSGFQRLLTATDAVSSGVPNPFWSRDDNWELTPPRSAYYIRRMLRRIHWLVRLRWSLR